VNKNRFLLIVIIACLLISSLLIVNAGESYGAVLTVDTEKVVINAAVDWLSANYSEFYDLQHVHADIVRIKEAETTTYYTLVISCETKLKAASVEDLPFVKGMYEELSGRRTVSEADKEAVDWSATIKVESEPRDYAILKVSV